MSRPKTKNRRSKRPASHKNRSKRAILFAPWRIEFILGPREQGCFLCQAGRLPHPAEREWKGLLLLARDEHALVMLNRFPYTGGHLLIAPRRHTANFAGLSDEENRALWAFSRRAVEILGRVMQPHGFNLGMNLGKAAGAGVEDHLHQHVLPRWNGDTNFLPVVAHTHTIPVALEKLWEDLRPSFREVASPGPGARAPG